MKTSSTQKRAAILRCLIEGNSIRATSRITGSDKNTIIALLEKAGEACPVYQDKAMVNLSTKVLQLDEIGRLSGAKRSPRRPPRASIPATCGRGRRLTLKPSSSRHGG